MFDMHIPNIKCFIGPFGFYASDFGKWVWKYVNWCSERRQIYQLVKKNFEAKKNADCNGEANRNQKSLHQTRA